jgi:excisionase family DNA binding protein
MYVKQNPTPVGAFSIREVMARTGIGRNRIYQLIREGRLTAKKLGTKTVIVASDLQSFLDSLPAMPSVRDPAAQRPPL